MTTSLVPRLKDQYNNQIRMKLKDDLGKPNIMEFPSDHEDCCKYGCR
ncbi:MAG: hypothetical protein Ct9H90mP11_00720 [Acidimicrobiales bacterium]|nr:MAG: hypothetical protein Ct9H90mP11_00720 [Acidimicrobiales bacterium]